MPLIPLKVLRGLADDDPCKLMGWVFFEMLSRFRFAIFVFVFIPSYFNITNFLSNMILVTKTISPINDRLTLCSKQQFKLAFCIGKII